MSKRKKKPAYHFWEKDIQREYDKWKPIKEMKRSFFVWDRKHPESSKEKEIEDILKAQNLRFYREVSFDMRTRFDFYIPLIDLIIEYDGWHHFANLEAMKKDIEKEKLLNRLGIKLIRYSKTTDLKKQIPYDLIYHPVLMKAS